MRSNANNLSPMLIGFVVAGLLMFAVVGIVRNINQDNGAQIQTAVAAGVAALQQPPMPQNNGANTLPAFNPQPPTVPMQPAETPFTSDPPVRSMTAEEEAAFNNREWLAVAYDRGIKNVYGGAWFPCRHIDPALLTFNTIRTDPALVIWAKLAPSDQNDIAKECQKP